MFMGVERGSFWKGFLTFIKITLFFLSAPEGASQRTATRKNHIWMALFGP
jgi:hypothetical protein